MTGPTPKILLLGLGNDILGDDAVGHITAQRLEPEFSEKVDVTISGEAGLALIELMEGYDRVLLVDSMMTGKAPPGSTQEFSPEDFGEILAPSPHYAGIPEVIRLAERIGIDFPTEIRLLGIEIPEKCEIREGLSPEVESSLPIFLAEARAY